MSQEKDPLFEPLQIGKQSVAGRIYKTATSETLATDDGYVTDELLEFYRPIAWAGTPLIISGNIYISKSGKSTLNQCGAEDDSKIEGLSRWAGLAHEYGSLIYAQLNHCGRQVLPDTMKMKEAVSASDVREKLLGTKPRPLKKSEIRQIVDDFASAAERCIQAGFDGIQIHAGHGYLLNQFLTPYTNRRTDEYGGSLQNRARFLMEVYQATRERVGDDIPIIMKINGADKLEAVPGREGLDTPDLVEVTRMLQEEGLDGVEITVGHYESGFVMVRGSFETFFNDLLHYGIGKTLPAWKKLGLNVSKGLMSAIANRFWYHYEGFNLEYAEQFKKKLNIPVICVGGFVSREAMEKPIREGVVDAVSCARSMIADPLLVKHIRENTEGPKCDFCNACIARAGGMRIDCYNEKIIPERDAMLAQWRHELQSESKELKTAL